MKQIISGTCTLCGQFSSHCIRCACSDCTEVVCRDCRSEYPTGSDNEICNICERKLMLQNRKHKNHMEIDLINRTETEKLFIKSLELYENGGQYAVIEWGEKLKLPFDFCEYCDCQVPYIMDQCEKICLVCWSEIDPVIPF